MKPNPLHLAFTTAVFVLCFGLARAEEGHDHGDASAPAGGPLQPRFTAASETFELVGVLSGRQLTLYLDRVADNAPVPNAQIELEVEGAKYKADERGDAVYQVVLKDEPKSGVLPITATITSGADSDLLVSEFDLHQAAHVDAAPSARLWSRWVGLVAGGVAALALLVFATRRILRSRQSKARHVGSSA